MNEKLDQKKAHRHREDLTGEHQAGDAGQVILIIIFLVVWVSDTFILHYTTFLNLVIPALIRIPVGAIVLILAGWLAKKSMGIVFGEPPEQPGVIRKGPFNVVRHPVYLAEILLYSGILLMSISLAAVVIWIVAIAFLNFVSRFEEKLLLERFGEDYERYMEEVPMWIPRF
ncbi:methyltransferase family protein [Acidobacteriota bacterium]